MKLSEALQAVIDNPEDLSTLPQLVARATEMEGAEGGYLERIAKLQDINKNYLAQIPIPGEGKKDEPQDDVVTFEDAQAQLLSAFQTAGGRV
jgi:putative N-acetylmannosamine-6-phosphate epimerase